MTSYRDCSGWVVCLGCGINVTVARNPRLGGVEKAVELQLASFGFNASAQPFQQADPCYVGTKTIVATLVSSL